MRKILVLSLTIIVLLIFLVQVSATTPTDISGVCGETANWVLDGGTLTIYGEGAVASAYPSPWDMYKDQVINIVIEEGISEIGDCIFMNHSNLVEVQFPKSLTHLGGQVFQGCDKITSISIPENVQAIGNPGTYRSAATTFSCAGLESVNVASENKFFCSVEGVLFDSVNYTLLCYPQAKAGNSYVVPDGIREIASGAFWFTALNTIELPNSIEVIGESAFSGTPISTIKIPDTVSEIPRDTFSNCDYLKTITIPKSVKAIARNAFASCDALEEMIFLGTECLISNVTSTIPRKTVLHGELNSDVQTYAITNGYNFVDTKMGTDGNYDTGNKGLLSLLPTGISASCPVFNRVVAGGDIIGGYQPTLVLETDPSQTTYQEIRAFVKTLIADCTTDHQKAYKILCWVNDNMTYEYAHFGVGETAAGIYQLWNNRCSNCEGYTQLNNFLLYLAGIPNAIATSIDHCWTVAFLDGEWCMLDATNRFFDKAPNEYSDINNIFFSVDNALVCVIDDMTGVKLASYGLDVRDNDTCRQITIPDYVTFIYGSTFNCRDYGAGDPNVVICGTVGSYAESYVKDKLSNYSINYEGNQFVASIKKDPVKPVHTHTLQLVVHKAATHEFSGTAEHYVCVGCERVFADSSAQTELAPGQIVIPAQGHQYVKYNNDMSTHWLICSCGKTKSAEEHAWSQWLVITAPTVQEAGAEYRSCSLCGYREQRDTQYTNQESAEKDIDDTDRVDSENSTYLAAETEGIDETMTVVEAMKTPEIEPVDAVGGEDSSNASNTSIKMVSVVLIPIVACVVGIIGLLIAHVCRKNGQEK